LRAILSGRHLPLPAQAAAFVGDHVERRGRQLPLRLLGMSADEVRALGLHTVVGDEEGWVEEVETEDVLYLLFKRAVRTPAPVGG
jgi:hypothetical protein